MEYDVPEGHQDAAQVLAKPCTDMWQHIEATTRLWPRYLGWEETCDLTKQLAGKLRESTTTTGYTFDVIAGLSRGGIAIADQLSRIFLGIPTVCVWIDKHSKDPTPSFTPPYGWLNDHVVSFLSDERLRNVLVVDDIARRGTTIRAAKAFLESALPSGRNVKSGVLIAPGNALSGIDYVARVRETSGLRTPFTLVEN